MSPLVTAVATAALLISAAAAHAAEGSTTPDAVFPENAPAWTAGSLASGSPTSGTSSTIRPRERTKVVEANRSRLTTETRRSPSETAPAGPVAVPVPLASGSNSTDAVETGSIEAVSEQASISLSESDLAANVPEIPEFLDRIGFAVMFLAAGLLAALAFRKRRLARSAGEPAARMRIVSRLPVSRKSEMCLVEVDGQLIVAGVDPQGIHSLVPLGPKAPLTFSEVQAQELLLADRKSERKDRPERVRPKQLQS